MGYKSITVETEVKINLCDIVGCGYHEPKDSLLNKLKDLM